MSVKLNKNPTDRVCECSAILLWAGTPARGQYRHIRPDGQMYITTHAPAPRPSTDDRSEPTPAPQSGCTICACRDCMDITVSGNITQPELCSECTDAGCEAFPRGFNNSSVVWECQRDDAYGDDIGDAGTGHGAYEYHSGA